MDLFIDFDISYGTVVVNKTGLKAVKYHFSDSLELNCVASTQQENVFAYSKDEAYSKAMDSFVDRARNMGANIVVIKKKRNKPFSRRLEEYNFTADFYNASMNKTDEHETYVIRGTTMRITPDGKISIE